MLGLRPSRFQRLFGLPDRASGNLALPANSFYVGPSAKPLPAAFCLPDRASGNLAQRLLYFCEMKYLLAALLLGSVVCCAQTRREEIHTDFVLYNKRVALEKDLRERVVGRHFSAPLDSNTEDGYLSGCWAVEQFLFDGPVVMQGFDRLFAGYASLAYDTKRALLEAVYAVGPGRYRREVETVMGSEADARLFALCAVYLFREDGSVANANALKIGMVERFPGADTIPVLQELQRYLSFSRAKTP